MRDEFDANDARRLHALEQFMRDRGYVKDRHGFWVPGAGTELPREDVERDKP